METYEEALKGLNSAQRQAVETIEGPLLVIAGPGTGKTQLLGVRVAHILHETDTLPQNVLCLTFTENGAENMRERLTRFMGQNAYDVNISTYHAFGGDLIQRFPEAFAETRLQNPADELTRRQILRHIVDSLPYDNPLKQLRHHLGDLVTTISEVKRALLTADSLRAIAQENTAFIVSANQDIRELFDGFTSMPRSTARALPLFEQVLLALQRHLPDTPAQSQFGTLGEIATTSLAQAIEEASATNKTGPLTAWKNKWLAKNDDNAFVFDGLLETRRIEALARVFDAYQAALAENGWYDFDDMIIRAIEVLEKRPDLRYSLQEQYLYILLDEFQDTNAAQLRLVQLLSDNPINEGRPNVMAVGDDDQAIYAFQGAQYSNMLDFYTMYRDVKVVTLTENYRSTSPILTTADNIASQIEARLKTRFKDSNRPLQAVNTKQKTTLERREFLSDVAQYDWIAREIKQLIDSGVPPREIAVLAPKHRQLQPLLPYVATLKIPIRYEKRENILEAPVVRQLLTMSELVMALNSNDQDTADALWPQVLSFDFWQIPLDQLWQLSWQIADAPKSDHLTWSKALLASSESCFQIPAQIMLHLAGRVATETCEQVLDYLIGTDAIQIKNTDEHLSIRSPLRKFYAGPEAQTKQPELFYDTISHLTVLRAKLRDYQGIHTDTISLQALLDFVHMYEEAEERLLNTSPYNQQADAVQLMTVFKAKGLEFSYVFLPCCQDDVWGSSSRGNANKLTLPANLAPIRHAGATDDERLRILFVAVTRAKRGLYFTSFARTYTGKDTRHLKYLDEQEQADGSFASMVFAEGYQTVVSSDHQAPTLASLELNWRQRHVDSQHLVKLKSLLADRIQKYQLSPTHVTTFIDLEYGGPEQFFFNTILRFPQAPTLDSQFGQAIHETLEWVQHQVTNTGQLPAIKETTNYFAATIKRTQLIEAQQALLIERGSAALTTYLAQRGQIFTPKDRAEHTFKNEGVFVGKAHLNGIVDRLEVNDANRTITVVDYKTGRSSSRWTSDTRLHKYKLQLYCYKLLIEGSRSFKGYTVTKGRIEFVEPNQEGKIYTLELTFDHEELNRVRKLLEVIWQRVQQLDFPNVDEYDKSISGIRRFEDDLLGG